MMKRKNRIFAFVLALVMTAALAGCASSQQGSEEDSAKLLEFPGTHWNDTPEQVIASLGLTEEQILYNDATDNDGWAVAAQNVAFLDSTLSYVEFVFVDYFGGNCGLCSILACFPEDEDMEGMRADLVSSYGPYSNTKPETYLLQNNQLVARSQVGSNEIRGEDGNVLHASETAVYWACSPEGHVTGKMKDKMFTQLEAANPGLTREVSDQLTDVTPLVQVTCDEDFVPYLYSKSANFTGNYLQMDASEWVMLLQLK